MYLYLASTWILCFKGKEFIIYLFILKNHPPYNSFHFSITLYTSSVSCISLYLQEDGLDSERDSLYDASIASANCSACYFSTLSLP